ncbi:MAG: DUF885 domain-containing protein, partial [Gammaproteobacteria bacterium]|nr:DUF885 domain-containing protein [Gammaproteobacteria bacterium]
MQFKTGLLFSILSFIFILFSPHVAYASDYEDLVQLFQDFRTFQHAKITDGVPDYSVTAVNEQQQGLLKFEQKLGSISTDGWATWQQVDYHLVRAEMNALKFHHKVHKPWARDPGFYSMFTGDAGATINSPEFFGPLLGLLGVDEDEMLKTEAVSAETLSLSDEQQLALRTTLQGVPVLYKQARSLLTEPAADFARFAIRNLVDEVSVYKEAAGLLGKHYPELAKQANTAGRAVETYRQWLISEKPQMSAAAGLGKENYDWWKTNVQLSPWGWEASNQIIQSEYNRVITFLKLEEHRNRDQPRAKVAMTEKAWQESLEQALHYVVDFLDSENLMTIDDWVNPADYYQRGPEEFGGEANDGPSEGLLPEHSSIDTKVRQREILPGETHEYIGHMLDYQRRAHLKQSPIRHAGRHFNMGKIRLEGWAVALEELLMQAGVLDQRPREGREMEYLMNASHMSLAVPDMKMQANEINLTQARHLCAQIMPRGWSRPDEDMVWFEMQSNQRNPGGFHSNVVTGKAYFMKLFREQAQAQGDDFSIKAFIDEFLS